MTKKEKIIASTMREASKTLEALNDKDLLKIMHTVNSNFENLSIFCWFEKHGHKKTKNKIKLHFSKK
jgi:hypothetical protein